MTNRLVAALDVREAPNGHPPEIRRLKGKDSDGDEEQFALSDDAEDNDR
jgi:hypothetical protein